MIDVSVVTHNSGEWATPFLSSLCAQDYPLDRISLFVIDNESEDNTLETIKKELARLKAGFAAVHLIAQSNLGFGVGHDRAIRSGGAAYCLVTNIDLEFRSDSLTTTVSTALDDQHGQVASWELRQIPYEHPKHYDPVTLETNWSSHACILLRRSAYETVGGYDPQIFMYTEDVELSYRFRSYGYVLRYVPNAVVHHYTYKSSGEVKPIQFFNSILGNIYLRIRYGGWKDLLTGFVLFAGMLFLPEPFPKARGQLLSNGKKVLKNYRHFLQGKGDTPAYFPFRAFDYEMRREGAFHPVSPEASIDKPTVTVITRSYHGREIFLKQSIQTVLNQTYTSIELIVVEDGGDSLESLVTSIAEFARVGVNIVFVSNPQLGRAAAGNAGLAISTSEYVMFLDDDDLLYADHIEILMSRLLAEPKLSGAYSLATEVLTDVVVAKNHYIERAFQTLAVFYQEWDYQVLLDHNFIPIQALVFRRQLYLERGGFDEALDQLEDWHLWLRYGHDRNFAFVPKTTSLFRSPANTKVRSGRMLKLHQAYAQVKASAIRAINMPQNRDQDG